MWWVQGVEVVLDGIDGVVVVEIIVIIFITLVVERY